jgi:ATP-binding cassette subfamily B protein RaxB
MNAFVLDRPVVKCSNPEVPLQDEPAECGLVCVAALASMYGVPLCIDSLRQYQGSTARGMTVRQVRDLLRAAGFGADAVQLDWAAEAAQSSPLIALRDDNHFVVLGKRRGGGRAMFDPAEGWSTVDALTIRTRFRPLGVAVTSVPTRALMPTRAPLKLGAYMSRFVRWSWIAPLLAASIVSQLLGLAAPYLSGRIVDDAGAGGFSPMSFAFVTFAFASAFALVLSALQQEIQSHVSRHLLATMTKDLLGRIFAKGVAWLANQIPERLAGKLATLSELQRRVVDAVAGVAVRGVVGLVALVIVAMTAWPLALLGVIAAGCKLGIDHALQGRVAMAREAGFQSAVNHKSALNDALRSASTIAQFGVSAPQCEKLAKSHAKSLDAQQRAGRWRRGQDFAVQIAEQVERALFLLVGAILLERGLLTPGSYIALALYREAMVSGLGAIREILVDLKDLRSIALRIASLVESGTLKPAQSVQISHGEVEISDLAFKYSRDDAPVFEGFNLTVRSGESIAIVGPSGAGKSTLAKLLTGALLPTQGAIRVGGHDIAGGDPDGVLANVGSALQHAPLLAGTVRENIDAHRGLSDDDIIAAAKAAEIHDFIQAQPMGYGTVVGDDALAISGGQRQRLLIARALAGGCRVLVMDEATSALDQDTERRIAQTIAKLDMTRIIIAHREETIRHCDRILRLSGHGACAQEISRAA